MAKSRRKALLLEVLFFVALAWTLVSGVIALRRIEVRRPDPGPEALRVRTPGPYAVGPFQRGAASGVSLIIFTNFRCTECARLSLRIDSLMALFPGVHLAERIFAAGAINERESNEAIACSGDFAAFERLRNEFARSSNDLEDGRWGVVGLRAGIGDTIAFIKCIKEGRHAEQIRSDSIAATLVGVKSNPAIVIGDSLFLRPLELDELSSRLNRAQILRTR